MVESVLIYNHSKGEHPKRKENEKMKLTPTQQKVYDELVRQVSEARECENYDEYWNKYFSNRFQACWKPDFEKDYLDATNGIISIYRAKHETLKKLETLGLVKIIKIETNLIQLID